MARTKISEYSATPGDNTDIDGINIAEGCAPSGINNAIREMMSQLKDFQAGTLSDPFNGPHNGTVGATTPNTGAFTTLSSTGNTTLGNDAGDVVTVNGATTFVNSNPILNAGTANGVVYLNGSKVLTSGSALTFDGTNLGIGTSSPVGKLQISQANTTTINGGSYINLGKAENGVGGYHLIGMGYNAGSDYAPTYMGYVETANNAGTAGDLVWFTRPAGSASTVAPSERMRLDSSGNLGIGTSSPGVKLHAAENSSGGAYLRLENTRTATFDGDYFGQVQFNGNDTDGSGTRASIAALCRGVSGQTDMVFSTAPAGGSNTERARIDSSGNLLVGTTSNAPAGTQSQFVNQWNGGSKWGASFNQTVSSATQYTHINFSTNGTTVGYINANNAITTYNSVSDHRLKTVLGPIADSGSRIDALEPIEYEWKIDGSRTRGFLAHEFQDVYPNSVHGEKDAIDTEGNPVYQALQAGSSEVIADLVAEIQSLRKRLAAAGI